MGRAVHAYLPMQLTTIYAGHQLICYGHYQLWQVDMHLQAIQNTAEMVADM